MRVKTIRITLLIVSILFQLYAAKIILKNGTVYTGYLQSESDQFINVVIKGQNITIFKSLIETIDGKNYSDNTVKKNTELKNAISDSNHSDSSSMKSDKTSVKVEDKLNGDWKVSLKNGSVFIGTCIKEDNHLIVLKSKGTPVTIYKTMIASIDSVKGKKSEFEKNNDISSSGIKKTVAQHNNMAASEENPPSTKSERSDGKNEILLNDGTLLVGKIFKEEKHSLICLVDGVSITILKQLIKKINGAPYHYQVPKYPVHDTISIVKNSTPTVISSYGKRFRTIPDDTVPGGITVGDLIDSIHRADDWRGKSRAARMLGAMGKWAVAGIPILVKLLKDTSQSRYILPIYLDSTTADVIIAPGAEAARALSLMGTKGVSQLQAYSSNENYIVRRHIAFGYGYYATEVDQYLRALLNDHDQEVRRIALGSIPIEKSLEPLQTACRDRQGRVRAAAAYLLGYTVNVNAVPVLKKMVRDKDSQVRMKVAEALGTIGKATEVPLLAALCDDRNNRVRAAAVNALRNIEDTSVVDLCIKATNDPSTEVRLSAITALMAIRNSRSIPSLYALKQNDENSLVKKEAAKALKAHTEIPLLIAALDSQSSIVRSNVSYILWLMTAQEFGQDKDKWESWSAKQRYKKKASEKRIVKRDDAE